MNSYEDQKADGAPVARREAKWWETAEDHRFALEVLQLPLRRKILKFVAGELKSREQIEREIGLGSAQAGYHLAMLEKALVIEQTKGGYRATPTGILYLEKVEARSRC
jgi:DNA-binding transcriptional ArsR family regulator